MKKLAFVALTLVTIAMGCTTPNPKSYSGRTQLSACGTSGATVTGFYVRHGRQHTISNAVPWTLEGDGISIFEIQTANPSDIIFLKMRYEGPGATVVSGRTLHSKTRGIRVRVSNGFQATGYSR